MKFFAAIKNIFTRDMSSMDTVHTQNGRKTLQDSKEIKCPSFEDEPWKSLADQYRPEYFKDLAFIDLTQSYQPLPLGHEYVRLYLRFLDTVPEGCWIDEENEQD